MHYRPGGQHPSSLTEALQQCQWHNLNNINCGNQKVIQFSTMQPLSLTLVHKSNVNMQTACLHQLQATGSWQLCVCAASLLPPRNKWPVLSFPPPRHNTVPPNHLSSANMTELCLKLRLLDDDTLRGLAREVSAAIDWYICRFSQDCHPPRCHHQ